MGYGGMREGPGVGEGWRDGRVRQEETLQEGQVTPLFLSVIIVGSNGGQ